MPAKTGRGAANQPAGTESQAGDAQSQAAGTQSQAAGTHSQAAGPKPGTGHGSGDSSDRGLTITIPVDRAVELAAEPVAMAGRALTAKGGLPIYAGLGALAIADVIAWPVAASVGAGYAILRWWGPFRRPAAATPGPGQPRQAADPGTAG